MGRAKGGFILVGGVIIMLAGLLIFLILVMCSAPANMEAAYCKAFSPLIEMLIPAS